MGNRRQRGRDVRGILLLDKPGGMTSNHALQRAKRLFDAAKAGHTGSLDPLATGMLPVCFGAATKLSGYLLDARKTYAVVAELGTATDTGDADGAVTERCDAPAPGADRVHEALEAFVGDVEQVPPMYSALKRSGRPLYELARRGIVVERPARRITIDSIRLDAYEWPDLSLTVMCSKGTYIRTLVEDLAVSLGTLGHVKALRRLAVAPFREEQMVGFDRLEREAAGGTASLDALLLPVDSPLVGWPRIELDAEQAKRLTQGQQLPAQPGWPAGLVCLDATGAGFFGIGEISPDGKLASRRLLLQ